MGLHELHPFTDAEIAGAPPEAGIYVLFQVETPLHVDSASNLRQRLGREKSRLPQATHFAIETGHRSPRDAAQRLETLKKELARVRRGWFAGPG
jgi:hypothetical protein